ncbi:sugar phosphate nucleotidyltransferase [Desulfurivibrio alkaliphilus]|uniref:Nucleotidyl transferase n=1 Tax=Desulfurivibrio alkaliphilus (strain DSM 19089 / UNIQEM U267 / AHT2) TaxID=589865 RepID=D6Z1Y6_DESAT|nr:sugar phosphate nucleotidyltransferase [Desulfurivibrio alkaliphilus]ADH85561.1 Nucleotidyl transferase [Desulfurivibrio alkaliphilus AHT 2]
MQAMILAAGLGTRLRPHTLLRPKPLFPVLDQPLLLRIIDDLRRAGCRRIVVNAFHLRQQIASLLTGAGDIEIQLEEMELGTGGGLRLARSRFGAQSVLVVNGDLFHNLDYRLIMEHHRQAGNDATLVLHDRPPHNKVLTDGDRNILSFTVEAAGSVVAGGNQPLAFTGIQVIEPALLELIPAQGFYHSIDWYRQLIELGHRVRGLTVSGHCWSDIGTPEEYLQLHGRLLNARAERQTPFWLGPGVVLGREVCFSDWVAVGRRAMLGDKVQLRRCVVWDGATVPAGTVAEDAILW